MHQRTRSNNLQVLDFDPDIEGTARSNRRNRRRARTMANQVPNPVLVPIQVPTQGEANVEVERTLHDYLMPRVDQNISSIRRPTIAANNFEIKAALITMIIATVQFNGLPSEDPNRHLQSFNEVCDTFRYNGMPEDFIKLKLFPFSLKNDAREWLQAHDPDTFISFEQLAQAFLNKYFPPGKAARLRNEITSFSQFDQESLYEAWERFKDLIRRCPHNGLAKWQTLQAFYQGITISTRNLIDAAAGGSLMSKTLDAAHDLIEAMAINNSHWGNERQLSKKKPGMIEVDELSSVKAQLATLTNEMSKLRAGPSQEIVASCEVCMGPHLSSDCPIGSPFASTSTDQVAYVNYNRNFNNQPNNPNANQNPQNNPYLNTYIPYQKNHPLSWRDNQNPLPQQANFRQPLGFQNQFVNNQAKKKPTLEDMFSKFITKIDSRMQMQDHSVKKLESRMEQIAQHSQA